MDNSVFYNIGKIIERESKDTTYKLALLRGVIDIIQDNSPFVYPKNDRVYFPLGLLIEKWLVYYYPLLDPENSIIQKKSGAKVLAFQIQFQSIISYYKDKGGYSAFYNDLKVKGIPDNIKKEFNSLVSKIKNAITEQPMRYIGSSIYSKTQYSIFNFNRNIILIPDFDSHNLIRDNGEFSIPHEYYEAFKVLGSFINGKDSILFKWAEFSVNASGKTLQVESVLNEVLKNPIEDRNINESKKLYNDMLLQHGTVKCVWTNQPLRKFDVDHLIPFSVWKNNDLWNLLPSNPSTNNNKRDKIPEPELIEKQKDIILDYWHMLLEHHSVRFKKEFQIALLGSEKFNNWQSKGIEQLKDSCSFLINKRGFEPWKI